VDRGRLSAYLLAGIWVLLGLGGLYASFRTLPHIWPAAVIAAASISLIFCGALSFTDRVRSNGDLSASDRGYLRCRSSVAMLIPAVGFTLLGIVLAIDALTRPFPAPTALHFTGQAARVTIIFVGDSSIGDLTVWTTRQSQPLSYQCGRRPSRRWKMVPCPRLAAWRSLPQEQADVPVEIVAERRALVAASVAGVTLIDLAEEENRVRSGGRYGLIGSAILSLVTVGGLIISWRRMSSHARGYAPDLLF
jgi:hypothetical protein